MVCGVKYNLDINIVFIFLYRVFDFSTENGMKYRVCLFGCFFFLRLAQ